MTLLVVSVLFVLPVYKRSIAAGLGNKLNLVISVVSLRNIVVHNKLLHAYSVQAGTSIICCSLE